MVNQVKPSHLLIFSVQLPQEDRIVRSEGRHDDKHDRGERARKVAPLFKLLSPENVNCEHK